MKSVLIAVPDLLFCVPVAKAVEAAGAQALTTRDSAHALTLLDGPRLPDAVVVDLSARIGPNEIISVAAAHGVRVFAFGPHLNTVAILDARAAGADKVVANSGMTKALPAWLASCLGDGPADAHDAV